ncbi:MAG: DUF6873 family GME fold protein [Pseudomonadota bacterium]
MGFIKTPFIPEGNVNLAVIDYRMPMAMEEKLNSMGVECIRTTRCKDLYESVDGHPDMLLQHVGGNRIILAPNIYEEMAPVLSKKGFAVTKGATWLARNYPGNIAYNILRLGNKAFHCFRHTDDILLKALKNESTKMINVKQGYTKCSVCVLDSNTIITSDLKLSKAAEENGIECLLIKPGGIVLKGLNYGFIGGASGLLADKKVVFTGSPKSLEDHNVLIEFLDKKGFEMVTLSEGEMEDYGSIIPLKCD